MVIFHSYVISIAAQWQLHSSIGDSKLQAASAKSCSPRKAALPGPFLCYRSPAPGNTSPGCSPAPDASAHSLAVRIEMDGPENGKIGKGSSMIIKLDEDPFSRYFDVKIRSLCRFDTQDSEASEALHNMRHAMRMDIFHHSCRGCYMLSHHVVSEFLVFPCQ